MKITIVGAGGWGTALANLLSRNKHAVTLWGHDPQRLEELRQSRVNQTYLPGVTLVPGVECQPFLEDAMAGCECAVLAVPSKFFREITRRLHAFAGLAVSVTKGIEEQSGLTMSGILAETAARASAAVLSGPTLALEVARGLPAAVVVAHSQPEIAREIQRLFHQPLFRVYTSQDVIGVELGGAVKNVVALAAGIGDGLGFGDNAKAGLITRGLAEMRRLGVARGALPETFAGLSGLGDLVVTCYSRLSRNRGFGERLGRGEKIAAVLESTRTVAEGYPTARSAWQLAHRLGIEAPIIEEVHATLYQNKDVRQAVHDLTNRETKPED